MRFMLKYSMLPIFLLLGVSTHANQFFDFKKKFFVSSLDSIPHLIPRQVNGKYGYINREGKLVIAAEYSNVGFFTEDCNLLNSPNLKKQKYGTSQFASVRKQNGDFRIDQNGKIVYQYKDADLGKCPSEFKKQIYYSYVKNGFYGIIKESSFINPEDYKQYRIYPQYHYLHVMEGHDLENPMIIASLNDKFGIIDVNNNIVIPFKYADIKRNYSWKLAKLFEVTENGIDYFFIDIHSNSY